MYGLIGEAAGRQKFPDSKAITGQIQPCFDADTKKVLKLFIWPELAGSAVRRQQRSEAMRGRHTDFDSHSAVAAITIFLTSRS
jgi:hypothetical protein